MIFPFASAAFLCLGPKFYRAVRSLLISGKLNILKLFPFKNQKDIVKTTKVKIEVIKSLNTMVAYPFQKIKLIAMMFSSHFHGK